MFRHGIFALSLMTAFAAPAFAEGLSATQIVERAVVTVDEDGGQTLTFELAEEIAPGDELRYRLTYLNDGDADAANVRMVMPVPAQVELIEGSADSDAAIVTYSIDNGESFTQRGNLTVTVDGQDRAATAKEITHIRWEFAEAIPAGTSGDLSYRGVLQ